MSLNLGTVVNSGNFSLLSDNVIEYEATIRAEDNVQNKVGSSVLIVSDSSINGLDQFSNDISLQVGMSTNLE